MGSGNNSRKLPNTAKNVGEKVVPSVRNEAQSLRTTKETIQPNNKAPGELYYLVFCDDVTCRKTPKKDGSREYKEREAVGLEPEPGTPLYRPPYRYVPPRRVWLWRRFGLRTDIDFAHFGLESGMVHKGTTVVYECVRRFNYK